MIKIFQRMRLRLLTENKFTRYLVYATGEIVLVVIGILIALQINNWNGERKEREREVAYLQKLTENLKSDLNNLDLNIVFYKKVFDYGTVSLSYAENGQPDSVNHWEVLVSFFQASQIWPLIQSSSTFEELKSSGELSLIKNVDLRGELSYYYGGGLSRYNSTIGIIPPYRKGVRGIIPSKIQNYMWEKCHVTVGDTQVLQNCESPISESDAREVLMQIVNEPNLMNELRFYMSSIKVGFGPLEEQRKLCKQMLDNIKIKTND